MSARVTQYRSDRRKMIDYISSQLPEGEGEFVLASGGDGDIIAKIMICGDNLEIESNCPEWVDLREVYEHIHWRQIPAWEQRALLFGKTLPSRLADLQKRHNDLAAIADPFPFMFRQVGEIWVVHFTVAGVLKIGLFKDHIGLQQYSMTLANQDRVMSSKELDGDTTIEKRMLIASEKNRKAEPLFGDISIETIQKAFENLNDKLAAARENGDFEAMDRAEDEIAQLKKQLGENNKGFYRKLRENLNDSSLEKTTHKSVSANLRRARQLLRDNNMEEVAEFLKRNVLSEGYCFAYRPLSPAPKWQL